MKREKNTLRIQMSYVNTGTRNNFIATAKTRAKIKSRKIYLIFLSDGVWMEVAKYSYAYAAM